MTFIPVFDIVSQSMVYMAHGTNGAHAVSRARMASSHGHVTVLGQKARARVPVLVMKLSPARLDPVLVRISFHLSVICLFLIPLLH